MHRVSRKEGAIMKAFLIVSTSLLSPYSMPSPVLSIIDTKMILMLYCTYPLGDRAMVEMLAINYHPMRYLLRGGNICYNVTCRIQMNKQSKF